MGENEQISHSGTWIVSQRATCTVVGLLCLILMAGCSGYSGSKERNESAAAAAANAPFAESYFDALYTGTRDVRKDLPTITRAGEVVAQRLQVGDDLFIACIRPDFVSEGMGRSGGLMLLRQYTPDTELSQKDAVIFSWTNTTPDEDLALARKLHAAGAYVVGIGPKPTKAGANELLKEVGVFLESSLPLPPGVIQRFKGESYPLVSLQNLTLLWTFTGEVVSALTRHGYMPVMYESALVPGAHAIWPSVASGSTRSTQSPQSLTASWVTLT